MGAWNWKVYWELEQKTVDGWDESSIRLFNEDKEPQVPIQLVHFHGPKPKNGANEIASCDMRAVQNVLQGGTNNPLSIPTTNSLSRTACAVMGERLRPGY